MITYPTTRLQAKACDSGVWVIDYAGALLHKYAKALLPDEIAEDHIQPDWLKLGRGDVWETLIRGDGYDISEPRTLKSGSRHSF